jgi:hypothetical protein
MKEYSCNLCGKFFNQKCHWVNHTQNKKYPCTRKIDKNNLINKEEVGGLRGMGGNIVDINNIKLGESKIEPNNDNKNVEEEIQKKNLCCRFCLKPFTRSDNLKRHITNEKCEVLRLQKQQKENIFNQTKKDIKYNTSNESITEKPKESTNQIDFLINQIKILNEKLDEQKQDALTQKKNMEHKIKLVTDKYILIEKDYNELKNKLLNYMLDQIPTDNNNFSNDDIKEDKFVIDKELEDDFEHVRKNYTSTNSSICKNEENNNPIILTLNKTIIEHRENDFYINATQLCKAGGKKFSQWYRLDSTKELIKTLETNVQICTLDLIDKKIGGNHSETWIHPDLAIQLAQWISPVFALQVSNWMRNLLTKGKIEVNLKILKDKENLIKTHEKRIKHLEDKTLKKHKRVIYKDSNVVYLITCKELKEQNKYIIGKAKDLTDRKSAYDKISDFEVVYYKSFSNEKIMKIAEDSILEKLINYKEVANKDRFILPKDKNISFFTDVFDKIYTFYNE